MLYMCVCVLEGGRGLVDGKKNQHYIIRKWSSILDVTYIKRSLPVQVKCHH